MSKSLDKVGSEPLTNGHAASGDAPAGYDQLHRQLVGIRRHLHQHPEIGLHEYETSRYIRETLEREGMTVQGPLARTGLYVDIEGARPGPKVAYRADIDALPIQDGKDVPYASENEGLAHLCGHDAHTTIAVGTAILVHRQRKSLTGSVRVFFQPNEEGIPSGAPLMIRDGVLDGVDAALASHVDPTISIGTFGLITGAITASADRFRVVISGPSTGHSARPHQSIDTIWVATQAMNAIYQVVGRRTDARNGAVIAICRLHAGEAYNVIPRSAEFGGTYRCLVHEDRRTIKDLIVQTANQIGRMHGAHVEIDFDYGSPPVVNDGAIMKAVEEIVLSEFGEDAIFRIPVPSMGAEDFAHYLEHVPGALIRVGTASSPDTSYVLHDAHFDIDERALTLGARVMSATLMRLTSTMS